MKAVFRGGGSGKTARFVDFPMAPKRFLLLRRPLLPFFYA